MLVEVALGGTYPFPQELGFGNVKPSLKLFIDTDGDVDAQIQLGIATGEKAWISIDESIAVKLTSLFSAHSGQPTVPEVMRRFEKNLATNTENIKRITEHVKTLGPALSAEVKAKKKKEPNGGEEVPASSE